MILREKEASQLDVKEVHHHYNRHHPQEQIVVGVGRNNLKKRSRTIRKRRPQEYNCGIPKSNHISQTEKISGTHAQVTPTSSYEQEHTSSSINQNQKLVQSSQSAISTTPNSPITTNNDFNKFFTGDFEFATWPQPPTQNLQQPEQRLPLLPRPWTTESNSSGSGSGSISKGTSCSSSRSKTTRIRINAAISKENHKMNEYRSRSRGRAVSRGRTRTQAVNTNVNVNKSSVYYNGDADALKKELRVENVRHGGNRRGSRVTSDRYSAVSSSRVSSRGSSRGNPDFDHIAVAKAILDAKSKEMEAKRRKKKEDLEIAKARAKFFAEEVVNKAADMSKVAYEKDARARRTSRNHYQYEEEDNYRSKSRNNRNRKSPDQDQGKMMLHRNDAMDEYEHEKLSSVRMRQRNSNSGSSNTKTTSSIPSSATTRVRRRSSLLLPVHNKDNNLQAIQQKMKGRTKVTSESNKPRDRKHEITWDVSFRIFSFFIKYFELLV